METSFVISLLVICLLSVSAERGSSSQRLARKRDKYEIQSCEETYEEFERSWHFGKLRLTSLLEELRSRNCSQFGSECERRRFAFNRYTSLVYDRFCRPRLFAARCAPGNESSTSFPSACEQVDMYNSSGAYLEIIVPYSPFCGITWCGFTLSTIDRLDISAWSCLSPRCRSNAIAVMFVSCLLAIVAFIANSSVLYLNLGHSKAHGSQILYRQSLALGDLLVALVVFPSFAATLYLRHVARRGVVVSNGDVTFTDEFLTGYLPTVGFFTSLSLFVSVYTLILASLDRMRAVWRPLTYTRGKASTAARRSLLLIWVVSIVFATLPIFTPGLSPYNVVAGVIVATNGRHALALYLAAFLAPFLGLWASNLVTWSLMRRQGKSRIRLTNNSKHVRATERRLATTLTLMLGAFTSSLLPTILSILLSHELPGIHYDLPDALDTSSSSAFVSYELASAIILASNSIWNFFIYSARDAEFRKLAVAKLRAAASLAGSLRCGGIIRCAAVSSRRRISSAFTSTTYTRSAARKKSSAASTGAPGRTNQSTADNVFVKKTSTSV